jgi:serine protease Do
LKRRTALFPVLVVTLVAAVAVVVLLGYILERGGEPGDRTQNVAQEVPKPSAEVPEGEPVAQVAAQVGPSVVQINVQQAAQVTPFGPQEGEGIGSGVIYRKDGYIVTNYHVVEDANEVNVAFADGSTERGQVVGGDPSTEIAVVKVDRNNLPAAKFAEGENLVPGQLAVAIGSPQGFQSTVTTGVISGLNREVPARLTGGQQEAALVDLIQTSAPISPGNSGGALADQSGEVVGINVAYLPPDQTGAESIGFAIPSDTATSVADQLISSGRVSSPYLGIRYTDLTQDIADRFDLSVQNGVIVTEVERDGPAYSAGLRSEDVITALDATKVKNSGDLLAALRGYKPGDTVTLTVLRGGAGSEENIEVKLGERSKR